MLEKALSKVVKCSSCGESKFTLMRLRDGKGKKVKPAQYVCVKCKK
jgi:hypothetical protein